MKINPPGGPTDISSLMGASDDGFDSSAFSAKFSQDINAVTDAMNHMISVIHSDGLDSEIATAFNKLIITMQSPEAGSFNPPLDNDLMKLEESRAVPTDVTMLLQKLHDFTQNNINLTDKSTLLEDLSNFRDNLMQLNSGVKSALYSAEDSPINTSITKSSVNQDFTNYENLLQEFIDGKVNPEDMADYQTSLYASFNSVRNDIAILYPSLTPAQASALQEPPFSFDDLMGLNANFCNTSKTPSMDDAINLMTAIKAMQAEVNSFNF